MISTTTATCAYVRALVQTTKTISVDVTDDAIIFTESRTAKRGRCHRHLRPRIHVSMPALLTKLVVRWQRHRCACSTTSGTDDARGFPVNISTRHSSHSLSAVLNEHDLIAGDANDSHTQGEPMPVSGEPVRLH